VNNSFAVTSFKSLSLERVHERSDWRANSRVYLISKHEVSQMNGLHYLDRTGPSSPILPGATDERFV